MLVCTPGFLRLSKSGFLIPFRYFSNSGYSECSSKISSKLLEVIFFSKNEPKISISWTPIRHFLLTPMSSIVSNPGWLSRQVSWWDGKSFKISDFGVNSDSFWILFLRSLNHFGFFSSSFDQVDLGMSSPTEGVLRRV